MLTFSFANYFEIYFFNDMHFSLNFVKMFHIRYIHASLNVSQHLILLQLQLNLIYYDNCLCVDEIA